MRNFQESNAKLGSISKAPAEAEKETKVIEGFLNKSERKREAMERASFIAKLDQDLITSPNDSPKPRNELSKLTDSNGMNNVKKNLFGAGDSQPKQSAAASLFAGGS